MEGVTSAPSCTARRVTLSSMPSEISRLTPEYSAFWNEYHLCTLTTLRSNGSPHVVPVGVTLDADAGVARVITRKSSNKVANIQASRPGEARAAVCQVDGGRWATLEGTAEVLTDAAAVDAAVAHYADRYGRTASPGPGARGHRDHDRPSLGPGERPTEDRW